MARTTADYRVVSSGPFVGAPCYYTACKLVSSFAVTPMGSDPDTDGHGTCGKHLAALVRFTFESLNKAVVIQEIPLRTVYNHNLRTISRRA